MGGRAGFDGGDGASAFCKQSEDYRRWREGSRNTPARLACRSFRACIISCSFLRSCSASSLPRFSLRLAMRARNWSTDSDASVDALILLALRGFQWSDGDRIVFNDGPFSCIAECGWYTHERPARSRQEQAGERCTAERGRCRWWCKKFAGEPCMKSAPNWMFVAQWAGCALQRCGAQHEIDSPHLVLPLNGCLRVCALPRSSEQCNLTHAMLG